MNRRQLLKNTTALSLLTTGASATMLAACGGGGDGASTQGSPLNNHFRQVNLVASSAAYKPQFLEPGFTDAWGIAIRPAGAGGHFWVSAGSKSYEYVGDVNGTPLYQDTLKDIDLPGGGAPTGLIFNTTNALVVTNEHPLGAMTAPAKFLFAMDSGVISAWTERSNSAAPQGKDWPAAASIVIDESANGSAFFGVATVMATNLLLVADFGVTPKLRAYNSNYVEQAGAGLSGFFNNPFATGAAGAARPGDYVPFNVTTLMLHGVETVFVSYAKSSADPANPAQFLPASEDADDGLGRLVQYSPAGATLAIWGDGGKLNAPWGVALAPANFGPLSNHLLVGNFGSGRIAAFDVNTQRCVAYMNDVAGETLEIEGLWALLFGNGASLGDANALYFAAGPEDEQAGVFGALRAI